MTDNFFDKKAEDLMESIGHVGHIDDTELRRLYYGRMGIYVSFSDQPVHDESGTNGSKLVRPFGVQAHSVEDVVGRKVSSAKLYGFVFRSKTSSGKRLLVNSYASHDYDEDIRKILGLDLGSLSVEVEQLHEIIEKYQGLTNHFERLWKVTRFIAFQEDIASNRDYRWNEILRSIGYDVIVDSTGKGIITERKQPVSLFLSDLVREDLDIIPIQKFRKDRRHNVKALVDRRNREMWVARNRIAKRKTDPFRTNKIDSKKVLGMTKKEIEDLMTVVV